MNGCGSLARWMDGWMEYNELDNILRQSLATLRIERIAVMLFCVPSLYTAYFLLLVLHVGPPPPTIVVAAVAQPPSLSPSSSLSSSQSSPTLLPLSTTSSSSVAAATSVIALATATSPLEL